MDKNFKSVTTTSGAPIMSMKGNSLKTETKKAIDYDKATKELAEKEAKLEAEKLQLETLKKEQEEIYRKDKLLVLEELVHNAKQYEQWAKEEGSEARPDTEKIQNYLHLARQANQEANSIRIELGLITAEAAEISEEVAESPSFWALHHGKAWIASLIVATLSIWACYNLVMDYKEKIDAKNATIVDPSLKIGNPYDESSIQGIIYDNLIQFTDIPKLWLFLLILVPPIFFYSLPFVKTKFNPWVDWQQLTPSQRHWLLFAYSALVFVVSVFNHLAGSSR